MNSGPSSSRTRIGRLPFGKAALATRTVSAGISPDSFGCIDIHTHPTYDNVGLQDHNQVLKTDVTQDPE